MVGIIDPFILFNRLDRKEGACGPSPVKLACTPPASRPAHLVAPPAIPQAQAALRQAQPAQQLPNNLLIILAEGHQHLIAGQILVARVAIVPILLQPFRLRAQAG
jgi:hypothetical protein